MTHSGLVGGFASEAEPREKTGAHQTSIHHVEQWPLPPWEPSYSVGATGKRVPHASNDAVKHAGLGSTGRTALVLLMIAPSSRLHIKLDLRPVGIGRIIPICRDHFIFTLVPYTISTSIYTLMPSPPRGYTTFPSDADLFYFCTTSSTSAEDLGINYAPPSPSSLRIGVIILGQDQTQLTDFAAVDLLSTLSRSRICKLNASMSTLDEAVDEVDVRYVSVTGEGSFPVTSGARMPVTVS